MRRSLFIASLVAAVLVLLIVSALLLLRWQAPKTTFCDDCDRVPPPPTEALPVIIDTDMAPDDWMAILFLLQRPDIDVRAITVVGTGEAHCGPGVRHALDLAMLAGRPEVPVACGRESTLAGDYAFPAAWRKDADRLLGLQLPRNPGAPAVESAVELLLRIVDESRQQVHLVALGPLTNVAEAVQADPRFANKLGMLTIMGGAVNVRGNVGLTLDNASPGTQWAEWNIYVDPHAADLAFASGAPITLVPLDATRHVPATMDFYRQLGRVSSTAAAEFVYRVLTQKRSSLRAGRYYFWDVLTAALVVDESLATFQMMSLTVIADGGPQSGRTVASDSGHTMRVATRADRARFEALFLDVLNGRRP